MSFLATRLALGARRPALSSLGGLSARWTSSLSEGSVASDKGWSDRERAAEGKYAHDVELEKLRKLRHKLEVQERDLESDMEKVEQEIAVRERDLKEEMNKKQDA